VYPDELCIQILKGIHAQLKHDGYTEDGVHGLQMPSDEALFEVDPVELGNGCSGRFRDDLTGQPLRDNLVQEARAKELEFFAAKGVWEKILRTESRGFTHKRPVSVRWVDVNKGDDLNPNYRSRLVARQLKAHDRSGETFFAPTPPLEALRTVLSLATTATPGHKPCKDPRSERRVQVSFVDVRRAYMNAKTDPKDPVLVELPPEDPSCGTHVALLRRHMYGTRRAADGWQEEYSKTLVSEMLFQQGLSTPCLFHHPTRELTCSCHGDDFTTTGPKEELDWFESTLATFYDITTQPRIGPGPEDAKEARVLNRIVRFTEQGIELEADPRQVEKLVEECGLTGANTVVTPGMRATTAQLAADEPLGPEMHTAYRAAAARANYLAADRIDCQYAAKEICRWMSAPTRLSWEALRRLCRFLVGQPRLVYHFPWQSVDAVDVFSDTDWAGCPRTRKSTSGGCVMLGSHVIKHWSSTQPSVTLSSGEAEFYGVVRGAGMGLGYQSLLRDAQRHLPLRLWTDSSAAIGICSRQGLGKLRHLDTHTLWVQQAVREKRVDLRKIDGEANPADIVTKHFCSRDKLAHLVNLFGCKYMDGRSDAAPLVRQGVSTRVTIGEAVRSKGEMIAEVQTAEVIIPHLVYSAEELDRVYPPMEAPDDPYDEATKCAREDSQDGILQNGLRRAAEIAGEAALHGRRRDMPVEATTTLHRTRVKLQHGDA